MLPNSLFAKIQAYPAELDWDLYEKAIARCAGQDVQANDNFRTWYEKSLMTFGAADWYRDLSSLSLTSLLAIGIPARRVGTQESYVTTISAFSAVSSNLSAALPKILGRLTSRELTPQRVRVKLAKFVNDLYSKPSQAIVSSLQFLTDKKTREIFDRDQSSFLPMSSIELFKLDLEAMTPTELESNWFEMAGLVAVGLRLTRGKTVLHDLSVEIARDLSIEISDVSVDIGQVASALTELLTMLDPYLETEEAPQLLATH
jgi:hypothetical protein